MNALVKSLRLPPWARPSRRVVSRILSATICSILVVLRPFSKLGGSSCFLALTVLELVFSVQNTLAQQLEQTFLGLFFGSFPSIAFCMLGKFGASQFAPNSQAARGITAVFLAIVCFVTGWLKSRLPRLTLASRISAFIAIWLLTADVGHEQMILSRAGNFMWIVLAASIPPLVISMLLLPWTSSQFASEASIAFDNMHTCLAHNLNEAFSVTFPVSKTNNAAMQDALLKQSTELNTSYRQSSFELRFGRVSLKTIKPLIGTVEYIRRELSWGMSVKQGNRQKEFPFERAGHKLGSVLLQSLADVKTTIETCFITSPIKIAGAQQLALMHAIRERERQLDEAIKETQSELELFCAPLERHPSISKTSKASHLRADVLGICLFVISLIEMAREIHRALHVAENCLLQYGRDPARLWHPKFGNIWVGMLQPTIILEARGQVAPTAGNGQPRNALSNEETQEGVAERRYSNTVDDMENVRAQLTKSSVHGKVGSPEWLWSLCSGAWNLRRVLRIRLLVSKAIRSVQHSPHLKHAFKNAACISLLAISAFMPVESSARHWFDKFRGEWLLITCVWVLETNTGATWRVGYLRLSGTILGCIYAYIASLICHFNPYGLVILIAAAELPISWIVINTSFPSVGVVASVTLPPILLSPYIQQQGEKSTPTLVLAAIRGLMISVGILAALTVNTLLFPRHCRTLFLDSARETLHLTNQLYLAMSSELFQHHAQGLSRRRMLKLELNVRAELTRMSIFLVTMNDELSLVPKPMTRYREMISILHRFLDLLTGLRRIRERIPRAETVTALIEQRKELVSCISMCLFACEQVYAARQPLPQFLPSARQALTKLNGHVQERMRHEKIDDLGIAWIYALGEADILLRTVNTLDDLLVVTRQLFGTSAWYDHHRHATMDTTIMVSMQEHVGSHIT